MEQGTYINEESVANTYEIVPKTKGNNKQQEENSETEIVSLPDPQTTETLNTNLKQEITWYLEFDGSVNKLGVGLECGFTILMIITHKAMPIDSISDVQATWQSMKPFS